MADAHPSSHMVVAAAIRRGDELLLVRQQGPDDREPSWSLPGGVVEDGELLTEALVREVREETGLVIMEPGRLAYVVQFDSPALPSTHEGEEAASGDLSTAFVFEVGAWKGELRSADPDGIVLEARFLLLPDALGRLEELPFRVMREPMVAYLRGEVASGTVWIYRGRWDGEHILVARLPRDS